VKPQNERLQKELHAKLLNEKQQKGLRAKKQREEHKRRLVRRLRLPLLQHKRMLFLLAGKRERIPTPVAHTTLT